MYLNEPGRQKSGIYSAIKIFNSLSSSTCVKDSKLASSISHGRDCAVFCRVSPMATVGRFHLVQPQILYQGWQLQGMVCVFAQERARSAAVVFCAGLRTTGGRGRRKGGKDFRGP